MSKNKVLSTDRKTVEERDSAACGMAIGRPVPRFQQPGSEQPHLHHFAANTVNFYPIPTLIPFRPINTNHPQKARMKS